MGKKVAIVLAGCGVYDGSEIHESSAVLVHLSREGAQVRNILALVTSFVSSTNPLALFCSLPYPYCQMQFGDLSIFADHWRRKSHSLLQG